MYGSFQYTPLTQRPQVGDVITYSPFGGGERRTRVTAVEDDVKNGRPGFDGYVITASGARGESVWGYDDQILRIEPR